MIFILDNYDSFTYNLVQRLGEIDASLDIRVARNDKTSVDEVKTLKPDRIIISPGPCTPNEAGLSKSIVEHFAPLVPMLGVCLGHQCMCEVFGWNVVRAERLMHGKVSEIHHDGEGVFQGLDNPFQATRYHSLIGEPQNGAEDLIVTAWTEDEDFPREIMGVRHREYPLHGVQFHPESFLTYAGDPILRNFLAVPGGKS